MAINSTQMKSVRSFSLLWKWFTVLAYLTHPFRSITAITYTAAETIAAISAIATDLVDFICMDQPLASNPKYDLLQVPVAASAVVPAYQISSLPANYSLVLDGESLAQIFMGNITTWDHPAIQLLNPTVTLPHANITIGITPGQAPLESGLFKSLLSLFSSEFASALASAGNDFINMKPAQEGRAVSASDAAARLQFVQVWPLAFS